MDVSQIDIPTDFEVSMDEDGFNEGLSDSFHSKFDQGNYSESTIELSDPEISDTETKISNGVIGEKKTVETGLAMYRLGFDRERSYVYCQDCKGILSENILRHLRVVHKFKITAQESATLLEALLPTPFCIDFKQSHQPFTYLDRIKGYQCITCKWCCKYIRNIKSHIKRLAACEGFVPCSIQSADIGRAKRYFRVSEVGLLENQSNVSLDVLMFNSSQALRSNTTPLEDFRTRRQFYVRRGWFCDQQEGEYILNTGLLKYVDCPQI